VQRYHQVTMLE